MKRLPVFLACAGLLLAQGTNPVERAWKLAASGQREGAVTLLRNTIQSDPRNADARLLLGSLLMDSGKRSEAIVQLSEAVKLRPHSADVQNALGEAYASVGDFKSALGPFAESVKLKSDFGVAQMNLGEALLNTGEQQEAPKHLDRAIQLLGKTDDAAYAHYLRAKAYTNEGESEKAASELASAVAIRPAFPQAWSDLGEARKSVLDDAGAVAALERAVALAPNDSVAQYRLGNEYLDTDKPQLAVEHLEVAYRLTPADQSTLNALQKALRLEGETAEADKIKQQLSELLRKTDEANQAAQQARDLNNEGARLEKAGDLASALTRYRSAALLAPQNVPIQVNYAIALLRLGQWNDGLNQLHSAVLLDPANEKLQQTLKEAIAQAPPQTLPDWARR